MLKLLRLCFAIFAGFEQDSGHTELKKNPYMIGLDFSVLWQKNQISPNRTGPVRTGFRSDLNFLKFKLLGSVSFCSLNRIEP